MLTVADAMSVPGVVGQAGSACVATACARYAPLGYLMAPQGVPGYEQMEDTLYAHLYTHKVSAAAAEWLMKQQVHTLEAFADCSREDRFDGDVLDAIQKEDGTGLLMG